MIRTIIILATALVTSNAKPAAAAFVENRAAWLRMNESQQLGYVSGFVDGYMVQTIGDHWSEVRSLGWRDCLQENEFNNGDILQMVHLGYQDVANWSKPPLIILISQINRVCAPYENRYRRERGLPDMALTTP